MQNQVLASQQIESLRQQLVLKYVQRDEAQAQLDEANKAITAIRNVLAGVGIGQQLQQELNAAQAEKSVEQPAQ